MPRYPTWPTTDQGSIVGARVSNELYHRFAGNLSGLSLTDQKDAALAELLATTSDEFNVRSFGAIGRLRFSSTTWQLSGFRISHDGPAVACTEMESAGVDVGRALARLPTPRAMVEDTPTDRMPTMSMRCRIADLPIKKSVAASLAKCATEGKPPAGPSP